VLERALAIDAQRGGGGGGGAQQGGCPSSQAPGVESFLAPSFDPVQLDVHSISTQDTAAAGGAAAACDSAPQLPIQPLELQLPGQQVLQAAGVQQFNFGQLLLNPEQLQLAALQGQLALASGTGGAAWPPDSPPPLAPRPDPPVGTWHRQQRVPVPLAAATALPLALPSPAAPCRPACRGRHADTCACPRTRRPACRRAAADCA
jgi:hypothetical protein